jgi:hypothetical protein
MNPLAAIYHPGGTDPNGYPVSIVGFVSNWSEETGTVTDVICVTTDGALRTFEADRVQVVDRAVAETIVTATEAYQHQRGTPPTVPPPG